MTSSVGIMVSLSVFLLILEKKTVIDFSVQFTSNNKKKVFLVNPDSSLTKVLTPSLSQP